MILSAAVLKLILGSLKAFINLFQVAFVYVSSQYVNISLQALPHHLDIAFGFCPTVVHQHLHTALYPGQTIYRQLLVSQSSLTA